MVKLPGPQFGVRLGAVSVSGGLTVPSLPKNNAYMIQTSAIKVVTTIHNGAL